MQNDLQALIKEGKITSLTLDRVNIAKSYIEKKYAIKKTQEEEKKKGIPLYLHHRLGTGYQKACRN